MLTHAAFALAESSLTTLCMLWSTTFVDFIRWIDEEWETLVTAIETDKLPQLPGTEEVYSSVATKFFAVPARAEELRKIGPPSHTAEGWTVKVWPKLELLVAVCSGTFGRVYPQVRAYIGPDIPIRPVVYACTECAIAISYDDRMPNVNQVLTEDYIELLEVTPTNEDGELKHLWQLLVGRLYEPVVTTRSGLWRYRMGDVVEFAGFSPADGSPLLRPRERRNQSLRLPLALISQTNIIDSIAGVGEISQTEFTTWIDDRKVPTVGFLVEPAPGKGNTMMDNLIEGNEMFAMSAKKGQSVKPTIRVLAPGTFGEFRRWKGELSGTGSSQVKLPLIMVDTKGQEFLLLGLSMRFTKHCR
ncbi:hypothetical protein CONPUDRAFT_124754 [Coniophora puteana RWD-64-598 SS2]|uniref:GH3 middle domain-containing protein n=1 Tax=Coniophora puteana (strain RWD-64-598) TaxID=741705 RepID=A0A5M3MQU0_CONPW|nr:uncharacterized protein CONPUDRAFT_124754 [Coniophora puteana RWD-64-598 SS2]EIW81568.1 hypothetical protein CONPUDRAFT_124754 [Coniophora puteana RWD-64-598 SS2]